MNIVLEGADATGKSTLAEYLSKALGKPIVCSEGPAKYPGEMNERVQAFLAMDDVIFCRHPVVSQMVYSILRPGDPPIPPTFIDDFYHSKPLIIYCREHVWPPSPWRIAVHVVKPRDTQEHLAGIRDRHADILALYDKWAQQFAHINYRIGDDKDRIVAMCRMFDPVKDVEDFHKKFAINYSGPPQALDFELLNFRLRFMREEMREYEDHANAVLHELDKLSRNPAHAVGDFAYDSGNVVHHLGAALDALMDLQYVTLGTAHLHGFDAREAWRRVHAANMAKIRAAEAGSDEGRFKLKMIKPPGWQAPNHSDLVENNVHRNQGHKPR